MKILIDIPKDFEEHFNQDKFKDSIGRIAADVISQVYEEDYSISGNYEIELLDMLSEAFEKAERIHSTCVLEGKPIYNDAPAQEGKWIPVLQTDITKDWVCSNCQGVITVAYFCKECYYDYCPHCGARMRDKESNND